MTKLKRNNHEDRVLMRAMSSTRPFCWEKNKKWFEVGERLDGFLADFWSDSGLKT